MIRRRFSLAKLSHWMEQDRGLKVLAVGMALLLWLQAVSDRNPFEERTLSGLPVRYTEADSGLVVVSRDPLEVTLVVRGRAGTLQRLENEHFQVYVDLAGVGPGLREHEIRVSPPRGVEVTRLSVETAAVRLDRLAEKEMPVRVTVRGSPAAGHVSRPAVVIPAAVTVSGAESRLERAVQAVAEVDLTGTAGDVRRQVPVQALGAGGEPIPGLRVVPAAVEVMVPVARLPDPVVLPVHVRLDGVPEPGYEVISVQTTPGEIHVTAEPADLAGVTRVYTTVAVTGQRQTFTRTVPLERPAGTYRLDPAEVTVRVELRPVTTTRVLGVTVSVTGLEAHLEARATPGRVAVTVRGLLADIEELGGQAVRVTVDGRDLSPGSYRLPLAVLLPAGLTLETVEPETVTLEVWSP